MSDTHYPEISITTQLSLQSEQDAIAICVFDREIRSMTLDAGVRSIIESLLENEEFRGKEESSVLIHTSGFRLLLLGLGDAASDDLLALRRAAATCALQARETRISQLHFVLPDGPDEVRMVRAATEGAILGSYDVGLYKRPEEPANQSDGTDKKYPERFTIIVSGIGEELKAEIEQARIIALSVNWVRTLSDEPGASLPPREFARRAEEMASIEGLSVESLNADQIQAQGLGGLWGVGKGSNEEPALIVIRYEPEGVPVEDELWAFVGKGITFDTGGISIKHGLDMYEMKSDMAGGAAVLGAVQAIARLGLKRRVVAIVPSAENMPSGRSIKPGDIVKTLAGYTIEVVDTDAEGRLVLSDGLAYARRLGASRIVDLATLTGSIVVALGDHRAGLFSNNDQWANQVLAAAARAGEPAWRMPVSDDYKSRIESDIADFKNYGGRPDAVGAALLLSKFACDTPWVHLDIAATSWYDEPRPYAPVGASGAGVFTLVELVMTSGTAPP
jgi:leucyl aminopeptidase